MNNWKTIHPYENLWQFEPRSAVYAFYDARKGLVYIGETTNMRARMRQHNFTVARYSLLYLAVQFPPVSDLTVKVSYCKRFGAESMRERRLIRRLQPLFNKKGIKARG